MLVHAEEALDVAARYASADADRRVGGLALVHLLQTIGEAATAVPAERREHHPDVPWATIVGMRNILVHAYWAIDMETVWSVATNQLPALIPRLREILAVSGQPSE